MKKNIIFTAVLFMSFFASTAFSQDYQKLYGTVYNDEFTSILVLSNGDYIISGTTYITGGSKIYVARTSSSGSILWQYLYGSTKNEIAYSSFINTNGNILIAGTSNSYNDGTNVDLLLFEIDLSGTVQWGRNYGTTYDDGMRRVTLTTNGIGLCATRAPVGSPNTPSILALEVSSDGSTINWKNDLSVHSGGGNIPTSLISSSLGGYILVAGSYISSSILYDQVVMRLNATGAVTKAISFGGVGNENAQAVVELADNSLIVMGNFRNASGSGLENSLSNLKSDLTGFNWVKTYGDNGSSDDRSFGFSVLADGTGYALSGYTTSVSGHSNDAILVTTDLTGQLAKYSSFGYTNTETSNAVIQNSDNSFTLVGVSTNSVSMLKDAYLVRTDANGHVSHSCSTYPLVQKTLTTMTTVNRTFDASSITLTNSAVTVTKSAASFTIADDPCVLLPVTFVAFSGTSTEIGNRLDWSTASEIKSEQFIIEKSIDATDWIAIGNVKSNGNSTSLQKYEYLDEALYSSKVYYRLKQVDTDGSYTYSTIITINNNSQNANVSIYPNPANDYLHFSFKNEKNDGSIAFTNMLGQTIATYQYAASEEIALNISELPKGVYHCAITTTEGTIQKRIVLK